MYCVIMAGGSGTRFWPYSRHARPKQLLSIVGEDTMLQMTVNRLKKIPQVKDIFIVTRYDLADTIGEEISGVSPDNIIVEPSGKNTAPCIGLSALRILEMDPEAVMGVFPADHLIVGHNQFSKAVRNANHLARKNGSVVTIGIKPTHPSTAYGYIQFHPDSDEDHLEAYRLRTFAEKPHLPLARRFLESGDFLWNAGIFVWKANQLLELLGTHMPDLHHHLLDIQSRQKDQQSFDDIWNNIEPESIDYGLMEKIRDHTYVIRAEFDWNDLGSWNAVYDVSSKSDDGNVIIGDGLVVSGKKNFIQSKDHFTAVVGVDNVVVVHTGDATLVIPKDRVEDVKELVEWLKKTEHKELL